MWPRAYVCHYLAPGTEALRLSFRPAEVGPLRHSDPTRGTGDGGCASKVTGAVLEVFGSGVSPSVRGSSGYGPEFTTLYPRI